MYLEVCADLFMFEIDVKNVKERRKRKRRKTGISQVFILDIYQLEGMGAYSALVLTPAEVLGPFLGPTPSWGVYYGNYLNKIYMMLILPWFSKKCNFIFLSSTQENSPIFLTAADAACSGI